MTDLATICDAIASEINALCTDAWATANSAASVTAARAYLHQLKDTDAPAFLLTIAPGTKASELATRGKVDNETEILLTFSKKLALTETNAANNALADPLMKTVELVQRYYLDWHALTGLADFRAGGAVFEGGGVYQDERMNEENFFWSFLTLKISGWD